MSAGCWAEQSVRVSVKSWAGQMVSWRAALSAWHSAECSAGSSVGRLAGEWAE
jgi:hypothetical protein